jgi:hypothetical protein
MKFIVNKREVEDYNLTNKELLELVRSENITKEEKDFLTSKIIERFSYSLCPKAGENEDDVFVRFFSNFVNGNLTSKEHVANRMVHEHRYLQGEMFKVCLAYIEKLEEVYSNGCYDGRNSYACETSSKIINVLREMNWPY